MKKTFLSLSVLILITITSCNTLLLNLAGLRKPKVEDKKSVYRMLKSMHQDTTDVYAIDSLLFEKMNKEPFKPNWASGFRPIQIRAYNSEGSPVLQWSICEGTLKELKPFDSVPPRNINGLNTSLTLQSDLSQYFNFDGKPAGIIAQNGYDYYILVYFAKYFPRWSKKSFRVVTDYAKSHNELKIKILKINVDVQKFWGVEVKLDETITIGGGN
jgi:hypothetical protein